MLKLSKRGVTLIELLIVISIISVLAVVMVTLINPVESGRKSRDAKRISDLGTIKRAIDLALADKKPLTIAGPMSLGPVTNVDGNGLDISKYLPAIPQDPSFGSSGNIQVVSDCNNKTTLPKSSMVYQYVSDGYNYTIRARFESMSNCNALTQDGFPSDYYELGTSLGLF